MQRPIFAAGHFRWTKVAENFIELNSVAVYREGQWRPLGRGLRWTVFGRIQEGWAKSCALVGNDLYVGGSFDGALDENGTLIAAPYLVRWDGSAWHPVSGITFFGPAEVMVTDGRQLYVAGVGWKIGDGPVRGGVARWNGTQWEALGNPDLGSPLALALYGQHLYFGGAAALGSFNLHHSPLWRWDGSTWTRIGPAGSWRATIDGQDVFPFWINDLVVRGDDLFISGTFTRAGGEPANYITRYNLKPANYADWASVQFSPTDQLEGISGENADPDGDGLTNREEFIAGSDPRNGESALALAPMVLGGPGPSLLGGGAVSAAHVGVIITFEAQAGRSYTVQSREGLTLLWRNLAQVPALDFTRIERILDPEPNAQSRFYRVVTPAVE